MQISSSYSMSGVPYDIKHRNGNVPQFNAEQAVKESENRYKKGDAKKLNRVFSHPLLMFMRKICNILQYDIFCFVEHEKYYLVIN